MAGEVKADTRTITLPVEDVRLLHLAASTAVQLYDGVEQDGGVPTHAPLYGKRDQLLELARHLDHEANCEAEEAGDEVLITLDPDCIHGENVREFYPEAVGMATAALEQTLTPGSRDHRDADILASCAVSEAFRALVAVQQAKEETPDAKG